MNKNINHKFNSSKKVYRNKYTGDYYIDVQRHCPNCKREVKLRIYACRDCSAEYHISHNGELIIGQGRYLSCRPHSKICKNYCKYCNGCRDRPPLRCECPRCRHKYLPSYDAPEFCIQLVGGSNSGKTTFLAALWHIYLEKYGKGINAANGFRLEPAEYFEMLERSYQQGISEATSQRNAISSCVIHLDNAKRDIQQFSIYDIAGEVFSDRNYDVQQEQFAYCDGFVVIIDPIAVAQVRDENDINDYTVFSQDDVNDVISGFCEKFSAIRGIKTNEQSNVPISVVITKVDIKTVKRRLGRPKVQTVANNLYKGDLLVARDEMCREYLFEIGLNNAVNNIEAMFTNIHYFPVSAIGHSAEFGKPYDPWGVFEAIEWIIKEKSEGLTKILEL